MRVGSKSVCWPRAGRRAGVIVALAAGLSLLAAAPAAATWSIIAVDEEGGEVGVAMAACSSAAALGEVDEVLVPAILVPGVGVAVVQGTIEPSVLPEIRRALEQSPSSAEAVVEAALATDESEFRPIRQYAVSLIDAGPAAAFDGDETETASAVAAVEEASAQGVLLASTDVVDATLAAYEQARAADVSLAEAMVAGLVAGSQVGGDRRCGEQTALFAQVAVAEADDDGVRPSTLLTVTVDEGDGQNPTLLLESALARGDEGWIDAGLRSPARIPRTAVLLVGLALGVASIVVIRRGMRMG